MLATIDYFLNLNALQWAGVFGFLCYFASFGAVQLGRLDGNSVAYSLANILAATLVGASLIAEFNLASALIQASWIVAGTLGLVLRAHKSWPTARKVLGATLETEAQQ